MTKGNHPIVFYTTLAALIQSQQSQVHFNNFGEAIGQAIDSQFEH
jgi:hypothetical protein